MNFISWTRLLVPVRTSVSAAARVLGFVCCALLLVTASGCKKQEPIAAVSGGTALWVQAEDIPDKSLVVINRTDWAWTCTPAPLTGPPERLVCERSEKSPSIHPIDETFNIAILINQSGVRP